jgi:hypothetical protein
MSDSIQGLNRTTQVQRTSVDLEGGEQQLGTIGGRQAEVGEPGRSRLQAFAEGAKAFFRPLTDFVGMIVDGFKAIPRLVQDAVGITVSRHSGQVDGETRQTTADGISGAPTNRAVGVTTQLGDGTVVSQQFAMDFGRTQLLSINGRQVELEGTGQDRTQMAADALKDIVASEGQFLTATKMLNQSNASILAFLGFNPMYRPPGHQAQDGEQFQPSVVGGQSPTSFDVHPQEDGSLLVTASYHGTLDAVISTHSGRLPLDPEGSYLKTQVTFSISGDGATAQLVGTPRYEIRLRAPE